MPDKVGLLLAVKITRYLHFLLKISQLFLEYSSRSLPFVLNDNWPAAWSLLNLPFVLTMVRPRNGNVTSSYWMLKTETSLDKAA